jgi:predicted dehydrogenase
VTHYLYEDDDGAGAPIVTAEGSWAMQAPYEFRMQFTVNFDKATAVYDLLAGDEPLLLYRDGKKEAVTLEKCMGYDKEIEYFLDCIARGERPLTVTIEDAADAVRLVEAEAKSVATGKPVRVK